MKILMKSVLMTSLLLTPIVGFSAGTPAVQNQGTELSDQLSVLIKSPKVNVETIKAFVEKNPSVVHSKNAGGRVPLDSALNCLANYKSLVEKKSPGLSGGKKLLDSRSARTQQFKSVVAYLASKSSEEVKRATLIRALNVSPSKPYYREFFVKVANINPLSITVKDGSGPNFEKNLSILQQAEKGGHPITPGTPGNIMDLNNENAW